MCLDRVRDSLRGCEKEKRRECESLCKPFASRHPVYEMAIAMDAKGRRRFLYERYSRADFA